MSPGFVYLTNHKFRKILSCKKYAIPVIKNSKRIFSGRSSCDTKVTSNATFKRPKRKVGSIFGKSLLALVAAGCALENFKEGLSTEALSLLDQENAAVDWAEVQQAAARANLCLKNAEDILEYHRKEHPHYEHGVQLSSDRAELAPPVVTSDLTDHGSRYFLHTARNRATGAVEQHLSVKGSTCAKNWKVNVAATKVWDAELGVHLHGGFKQVADAILSELIANQLVCPEAELHLSGHSQGGSVATIVAAKLQARGFNVARIITFGAPGFTTAQGAKLLANLDFPLLRVDNHFDIIPYVAVGYKHFGDQLLLLKGHSCSSCDQVLRGFECKECHSDNGPLVPLSSGEAPMATLPGIGVTGRERAVRKHFSYLPAEKITQDMWWANSLVVNFSLRNLSSHRMKEYEKEIDCRVEAATPVPPSFRYQRKLWAHGSSKS